MLSICSTRTRTGEVVLVLQTPFGVQPLPLRSQNRNDVVPILSNLIRFSRANPPCSRGQNKTRSGENRASAIRIVGPHQIYR